MFVEIGVRDAEVALGLRRAGFTKYLGVSSDANRIARLQAGHPQIAAQLTHSPRRKLVSNNNAQVLILGGHNSLHLWRYRSVRHAQWVAWPAGLSLLSLLGWLACAVQMLSKRYSRPRLVELPLTTGKKRRLFVSRIGRQKACRHQSRHFVPHAPGLAGLFKKFDEDGVRYAVLRWFERLPEIEPDEDVDLLVGDESVEQVLKTLYALPGIQPCDLYSASGLARSAYCGTPYYPVDVANKILDGAVRHNGLCMVPNASDYFHSLAYHAVYHKGANSHLDAGASALKAKGKPEHDYSGILREMATRLGINVEISLAALDAHLQRSGWAPSPEMLVRLAVACKSNHWLRLLAQRQPRHLLDQGLAVFVIRQEAARRGFQGQIVRQIEQVGFEILATHELAADEVEFAAARSRGGNWEVGEPFHVPAGPPAVAVIAYDRHPLPLTRRQHRRFSHRTNARIFVKEAIRDASSPSFRPDKALTPSIPATTPPRPGI